MDQLYGSVRRKVDPVVRFGRVVMALSSDVAV